MLVNYVTFEVDTDDREAFDQWYLRLADDARQEDGCILYVYLKDPRHPTRGVTVAAWRGEEDIAAHRLHPSHIELLALGSTKWGMRNITVHSFRDVGQYSVGSRTQVDGKGEDEASRVRMHSLIRAYQAALPPGDEDAGA